MPTKTRVEELATQRKQRANRRKWNEFRASFGLKPLPKYEQSFIQTAAEAQQEADDMIANGGTLMPLVPIGTKLKTPKKGGKKMEVEESSVEEIEEDQEMEDLDDRMDVDDSFDVALHQKNPIRGTSRKVAPAKSKGKRQVDPEEDEYEYINIEVDGTSGDSLAKFLKTQPTKFLVEMQKELMENDPRTFSILSEVFTKLALGSKLHENPHVREDVVYNPYRKRFPWPITVTLPVENIDYFSSEREKAKACKVQFDPQGRGVNAGDFMKDNIQAYLHTSAGTRCITTHSRILSSINTSITRTKHLQKLYTDRQNGLAEVQKIYRNHFFTGYRLCTTIREAFDIIIRDLKGPKSIFVNSNDWFLQTLEVVGCHPEFCLLFFEEDTEVFLDMLTKAVGNADEWRRMELLEVRGREEWADLMGEEEDRVFEDCFVKVPGEGSVDDGI